MGGFDMKNHVVDLTFWVEYRFGNEENMRLVDLIILKAMENLDLFGPLILPNLSSFHKSRDNEAFLIGQQGGILQD